MAATVLSKEESNDSDLIQSMNALQNKLIASGHNLDISLPQIVVVGCQSAGKSSVLQRFVQKEFLPRGSNQVTRRPIVVQLVPSSEEYGVFLHLQGKKFYDFDAIRQEIIRYTEEECKPLEFSKNPISLTIYSPKVLKLTLVDLPGIIRVPVGEQTEETVMMVRDMVLGYIEKPNSIILAVTPVSQDIANSDALELANIADPERERTIGVLTKIDMIEEGTDARDILENNYLPLKRGWVGVINRNSKEVNEGKDMEYIFKKERLFFQNHELYSHMAHRMGIPYLQKLLHKTLRQHIKKCLPDLRREISQKLYRFEKEMKEFEKVVGEGDNVKKFYLITLVQKFCDDITVKIMGYSEMVPCDTLTHGALINFKLHNEVQSIISHVLLPDSGEIVRLIPNINGFRNSVSIPSLAVDSVCKKLIERFKEPLDSSVICIRDVLFAAIKESAEILASYPTLKNEILYHINSWIEKESEDTKSRLRAHVDAEMFFINTGHPDFDSSICDPVAPPAGPVKVWIENLGNKKSGYVNVENEVDYLVELLKNNEQMQKQVQYVTTLVIKYLEIVQKQVSDIAVKYIAFFLIKKILYSINHNLVTSVLDSANISSLTEDCDEDIQRYDEIEKTCNTLKEALDAIRSF